MAKVIMVQGTMSNVGKSFLVAGLCRVFSQDGYKVAPFKSQNMALNSFITEEGLEMGRAQVMQAEAAGIKPSVLMNPILLKPTTDMGSQVIVNGKVVGNMHAMDYFKRKRDFIPEVLKAYKQLDESYDIIVVEGAGSPAEINLKQEDIVNMGLAKEIKAPVLLVGDIDRGGVFAQLIGTIMLLEEDERALIKGNIINKFRGDINILGKGLDIIEEKSKVPVLGVLPYADIDLDDEDSLSERLVSKKEIGQIDIAVIHLPKISNFTDLHPFECIEGVSLRYVKRVEELGNPDLIIIPGTKNTMADLKWLRQNGLESTILKAVANDTLLFGICGGFQMLGKTLSDPCGVEGGGDMRGMEVLPMHTEFGTEKVCTQVKGKFLDITGAFEALSGVSMKGYEIHMGKSTLEAAAESATCIFDGNEEKMDGAFGGNICGSYVHGIFDEEEVTSTILSILLKRKGLEMDHIKGCSYDEYKEKQYDKLAQIVREGLDMKRIYEILEEGV